MRENIGFMLKPIPMIGLNFLMDNKGIAFLQETRLLYAGLHIYKETKNESQWCQAFKLP
jgi:hypothetical protein